MDRSTTLTDDELAIDLEYSSPHSPGVIQRTIAAIREFATVSEVLRTFGAIIMVISMSVFLLQGWSQGNDISRYLKLLTQTGLLATGGFLLSYLLKEYKGARLFFSLGLLSVPINFTVLGALVYSIFNWDSILVSYPSFAHWIITDVASTGTVFFAALVVLVPVVLLGFRILTRNLSGTMSMLFLGVNALLLVPTRQPLMIGLMVCGSAVFSLLVIRRFQSDQVFRTTAGRYALALMFLPGLLLVGRSMFIYGIDEALGLMVCATIYCVCRMFGKFTDSSGIVKKMVRFISMIAALGGALFASSLLSPIVTTPATAAIFSVVMGLFMVDYVNTSNQPDRAGFTVMLVALLIAANVTTSAWVFNTAGSALVSIFAGLGLIAFGVKYRSKKILIAGAVSVLLGSIIGLDDVFVLLFRSSWMGLAALGSLAIVLASLVDRYGALIKLKIIGWKTTYNDESAQD